MKHILLFFSLLLWSVLSAQTNKEVTISGTISDVENGETLIGATVEVRALGIGTSSNEYGFYSLSFEEQDSVWLTISYVGFATVEKQIAARGDLQVNIELGGGRVLEEVVVNSNSYREQLSSTEMSIEAVSTKQAKVLPALFGEVDIIKTIQLKPGISSGSEGSAGLYVRGGAADQNLIVLDEALVYNASHLFGFFSTFNADAIKDVKIYKGGFPAQYGGRLSSVIDVKLKDGNQKKFSGTGGLGLISSRLTIEGPIVKDKASFIVSGRRTYVDLITSQINKANEDNPDYNLIPDYNFYDLNAKLNYEIGPKDKLFLSGYFGRDVFDFSTDYFKFDFNWGNATGTVRWNHQFSPKLFANTTITYSDYQYQINNEVTGFSFNLGSDITDSALKTDLYYALNNQNTIRAGLGLTYHQFNVGRLKAGSEDGAVSFSAGQEFDGIEFGAYISDEYEAGDRLKINGGIRFSGFSNHGTQYYGLEPRFSSKYSIFDWLSLKASYARMNQYVHLVSNSGISLPTDIWYPSTELVKPQISDQLAAGFSMTIGDQFLFTNEYYYKWMENQVDFIDHAQLFANDQLEQEFTFGKGRAYGMELAIEKNEGTITGWIGYTFARIERGEFADIDGGKYFPPRYDRRHDLSAVLMYNINKRFTLSASFVYGSGDVAWLPSGKFTVLDVPGGTTQTVVPVYGERNTFRYPAYHRMDLGFVVNFFPKWGKNDLTLSIYNVYDRRNPYFIYLEPEFTTIESGGITFEVPSRISAQQTSLFPILPSLTWNFSF